MAHIRFLNAKMRKERRKMFFYLEIFFEFQVIVNRLVFCSAQKPTTLLTLTTLLATSLLTVKNTSLSIFSSNSQSVEVVTYSIPQS